MDTKKILSWIALLGGEAILIAAFILFRGTLSQDILILNIIVSSVIYSLFFMDVLLPWVDLKDKAQKKVGSLGIRWFFTSIYIIGAVAVMIMGNVVANWALSVQIIAHAILLFILILGLIIAFSSSDKVNEVYEQEKQNRSGVTELKTAIRSLKDIMNDIQNLPDSFKVRINSLEDNLRYLSPTNNTEACDLERTLISTINDIAFAVSNYTLNEQAIEANLKKAERAYQNRKAIYSN